VSEERIVVVVEGKGHTEEVSALTAIKEAALGAHSAVATLNASLKGGATSTVSAAATGQKGAVEEVTAATKEGLVWVKAWGKEYEQQKKGIASSAKAAAKEIATANKAAAKEAVAAAAQEAGAWATAQKEIMAGVEARLRQQTRVRKEMGLITKQEAEAEFQAEFKKAQGIFQLLKEEVASHKKAGQDILAADRARIAEQNRLSSIYVKQELSREEQISAAWSARNAERGIAQQAVRNAGFAPALRQAGVQDALSGAESAGDALIAEQNRQAAIRASQKTFADMFRERDALGREQARKDLFWIREWDREWKRAIREVETERARAARKAESEAARAARAANKPFASSATSPVFSLGATLGTAFLGMSALKSAVELTDAYQSLSNRVRLVTNADRERIAVEKELFDLSNRSRVSVEASSQVYQRLATSISGLTQREILAITETINKAAVVGGSTAIEAEKGILQLTQGFSRGVLRGDELRSVLEQLPGVADVLADHFNVARGGLFALGEAGKITGEQMVKAFRESREEIETKFGKTIPTLGQAFQILRTNIVQFVGSIQSRTGVFGALSLAIVSLSESFELFGRVLATAAIYKGIQLIQAALIALYSTSGLGIAKLLFAGLVAASLDVANVTDAVGKLRGMFNNLKSTLIELQPVLEATVIALTGTAVIGGIRLLAGSTGVGALVLAFGKLQTVLTAIQGLAVVKLLLAGGTVGLGLGALAGLTYYGATKGPGTRDMEGRASGGARNLPRFANNNLVPKNYGTDLLAGYASDNPNSNSFIGPRPAGDELGRVLEGKGGGDATGTGGSKMGRKTFAEYLDEARDALEVLKQQGAERTKLAAQMRVEHALRRALLPEEEKIFQAVQDQIEARKSANLMGELLIERNRQLTAAPLRGDALVAQEARFALADSLRHVDGDPRDKMASDAAAGLAVAAAQTTRYQQALDQITGSAVELTERQATLNKVLAENPKYADGARMALNELEIQYLSLDKSFGSGAKQGFLQIENGLLDIASTSRGVVVDAFNGATDALVNFAKTGKLEISDLVTSILSDLAKLAIQQSITGPLFKALSGAVGSIFNSGTGLSVDSFNDTLGSAPGDFVSSEGRSAGFSATGNTSGAARYNAGQQMVRERPVTVIHQNYANGTKTETQQSTGPNGEDLITLITRAVDAKQVENASKGVGSVPTLLRQAGIVSQGTHR